MCEVAEEYDLSKQRMLNVMDSTVGEKVYDTPLVRDEVQLAMRNFPRLKIFGQWKVASDVASRQLNFHRKRLLLKTYILGIINTAVDYSSVFLAVANLSVLDDLETVFGEGTDYQVTLNLLEVPRLFCDMLETCFRVVSSTSVSKVDSKVAATAKVARLIQDTVPPALQYLPRRCLEACNDADSECPLPNL